MFIGQTDFKPKYILYLLFVIPLIWACKKTLPQAPADNELLDGMVAGLNSAEKLKFIRGDEAFNNEIFTAETGLGPVFIASSCAGCHAGDGKGHPFFALTRFGQSDTFGNVWIGRGGPQLQHRAIPGFKAEVLPEGVPFTRLVAPAASGLGFLELIPDTTLLRLQDPFDINGDGISGRVHWVALPWYAKPMTGAVSANGKYIGRFGKKAGVYNLLQQTAGAYNQDMGVISVYEPIDPYTELEMDPEVSNARIEDVVFYLQTLKAPLPRNTQNADFIEGKKVFMQTGCGNCHIPQLKTGSGNIAALSNKTIEPYTDLLLHDMGDALNDGYTEGTALPQEWRTPALWGLGLSKNAQGGSYHLMHDGRAASIEEAILLHGGEAMSSRNMFHQLSTEKKNQLLYFLEQL